MLLGADCKKEGDNVKDIIAVTLGSPYGNPQVAFK